MTPVSSPSRTAARPRRVRPPLTEARRRLWAVCLPLAVTLSTLTELFPEPDDLAPSWVWLQDKLRVFGLLFGGPFAFTAGCLLGGREAHRGTKELYASLPASALRRTALAAVPAVLWPVVVYVLTATVAITVTAAHPRPPYGYPFATLLVADAAALGSLGLLGYIAGRLLPWLLAAPVLGGLTFFALYGSSEMQYYVSGSFKSLSLLGPSDVHRYHWEAPTWWFGPASALWFGGLAATALLAYAARRRVAAAAVALSVALAGAGLIVGNADSLWRTDPEASALTCTDGSPEVCLLKVRTSALHTVEQGLTGVTARLRSIPNTPERLVEVPLGDAGKPVPGTYRPRRGEVAIEEPARNFFEYGATYAEDVAYRAALFGCSKSLKEFSTPIPQKYSGAVAGWLSDSKEPYWVSEGVAEKTLHRLRAMPADERTAWLGDYFAAARDCTPKRIKPL